MYCLWNFFRQKFHVFSSSCPQLIVPLLYLLHFLIKFNVNPYKLQRSWDTFGGVLCAREERGGNARGNFFTLKIHCIFLWRFGYESLVSPTSNFDTFSSIIPRITTIKIRWGRQGTDSKRLIMSDESRSIVEYIVRARAYVGALLFSIQKI